MMAKGKPNNMTEIPSPEGSSFLVTIPCQATDEDVDQALRTYLSVPKEQLNRIRFMVLIEGEQAETSKAAEKVRAFLRANPNINIQLQYKERSVAREIHEIRRALLDSLATKQGMDEVLVVSHDPSLRQIQTGFFDAVEGHFSKPNVTILAGFVDHSYEAFDQDHYLLVMQMISDVLEEKWRKQVGILARGANAAFRLKTIKEPSFHEIFDSSGQQKFAKKEAPSSVLSDDEHMVVTLSAKFLRDAHPGTREESARKVTSDGFAEQIAEGLTALYQSLIAINAKIDCGNLLIDAAKDCGMEVEILESRVRVINMGALRQNIIDQWSRF